MRTLRTPEERKLYDERYRASQEGLAVANWRDYKYMVVRKRETGDLQDFNQKAMKKVDAAVKCLMRELNLLNAPLMLPVFKIKMKRIVKEEIPEYIPRLI